MSENKCPECNEELTWEGQYHCKKCSTDFKKIAFCPECLGRLEKLQACGAANYFCNDCNELKSKSRIRFEFHEMET
ncbi:zinc ribbon domain-containing protein [Vibrio maerlii]|uniref:zinc ribbon domain-containing protein n=1 Tax=Vibrio maerlii TaxID=2231648 RepID=UPI000E3BD8C2|nr:zinc ribbon domain-containing protein [Vibrio maerlii]